MRLTITLGIIMAMMTLKQIGEKHFDRYESWGCTPMIGTGGLPVVDSCE